MLVLLSDSDAPLYPPALVHAQLLAEAPRSRVHACQRSPGGLPYDSMPRRWSQRMRTPRFELQHWRKSFQWVALQRAHAVLVVTDDHVVRLFERCVHGACARERACEWCLVVSACKG